MTKEEKDQVLANYKQQFHAIVEQREFASAMVEEYARRIARVDVEDPNFFSLGIVDNMFKDCRQFLKFYELRQRSYDDAVAISNEIEIIQDMK